MFRHLFFKMLMTQEGASPGGGASGAQPSGGAPTPAPASPPASQGAAPAPNAVADEIRSVVRETFGDLKNTLFADLRKAGAFKTEKTTTENPPAPDKAAASSGMTATDVQKLLERERVFTRAATTNGLDDAQLARMQRAAQADNPEDIGAWSTSYLTDMRLLKGAPVNQGSSPGASSAGQQLAIPGAGTSNPPASNKPPPPQGGAPRDFESFTNPNDMTDADYQRLVIKHGEEKADDMVSELGNRWLSKVRIRRPGAEQQE